MPPADVRWLTLNGEPLPPGDDATTAPATAGWECDVTPFLKDRNELLLRASDLPATAAGGRTALPESWGRLSLVIVSD
jgi:hypothetical protein